MRKMRTLLIIAGLLAFGVSASMATIGWNGNIYPCNGATRLPTENIDVYMSVWKDGCTNAAGQCADLEVYLNYKSASDAGFTAVLMNYCCEDGNNDRFMATIPSSATIGGENMEVYIHVIDNSDGSTADWAGDECGNAPNLFYIISEGTSIPIEVTFQVDMNCVNPAWYAGGVHFVGSHTGWGLCAAGTEMSDGDNDGIWTGTWTFPAGSVTNWEYKFQRNDGSSCVWMDGGNFSLVLDESGGGMQTEPVITWVQNSWGPEFITGGGSFCAGLTCCENRLWIRLDTPYNPPTIANVETTPGCSIANTQCDNECAAGAGAVSWDIVQGEDLNWYLRLCLIDDEIDPGFTGDAYAGCFCITIDQILPVELASYDAIAGDGEVTLTWATATETDNDHFVIARDGATIGMVDSKGNNASGHGYSWIDGDLVNGTTYNYSVSSVSLDGAEAVMFEVSATPGGNATVAEYSLSQNYPNPFNPATSISYSVPEAGLVTITVFDITGREVATLVNNTVTAGSHSVEFNAAGLASGIYMYRMEAGEFSAVSKMVLMK